MEARADKNWFKKKEVNDFIMYMSKEHGFSTKELKKDFNRIQYQKNAFKLINPKKIQKKRKSRSWQNYKNRFVNKKTIMAGREFMLKNRAILRKAKIKFGVPAKVIVGILGVETRYGKITGDYKVVDTLATFAFENFKRKDFFLQELEHLFLLARENDIEINSLRGSFAGALGIPQFMPSSWRRYAVDFDNDGKINLLGSTADAIGSIANYLHVHGWRPNNLSHSEILVSNHINPSQYVANSLKAVSNVSEIKRAGFVFNSKVFPPYLKVSLIDLEENDGSKKYWLATSNFFAITKYNRSFMYAAAVLTLAESLTPEIKL